MSVTLTNIITKVRYLLGDVSTSTKDVFIYEASNVFTLTELNPISVTNVYKNGVVQDTADWSYSSSTKKVTISFSASSGDTIEIEYTYYPNYSDTEISSAVRSALDHITVNNYKTFLVESGESIYPEPDKREQSLIAMVASLILEPDNQTIRLPDMSITRPKDLPTATKISRLITVFKKDSHGKFFVV